MSGFESLVVRVIGVPGYHAGGIPQELALAAALLVLAAEFRATPEGLTPVAPLPRLAQLDYIEESALSVENHAQRTCFVAKPGSASAARLASSSSICAPLRTLITSALQ